MRGHIKKLKNGRYYVQVYIGRGGDGKPKYRSKTCAKKHDAESWLTEQIGRIEGGSHVDVTRLSLAQFVGLWLEHYAQSVAPRTREEYRKILDGHVIPRLGHIRLAKLRAEHIQGYYTELLKNGRKRPVKDGPKGLSARTVLHHHTCLHKLLKDAVLGGYLITSPMDGVVSPRAPHHEARYYTPAEVQRILQAARRTSYYLPIAIATYTGMRRGEILGLQWADVDLERGVIHVRRSLEHRKGGGVRLKEPKTPSSRRAIPVPPVLVADLRAAYFAGMPDDALVVTGADGRAITPDGFTWMFGYVLEKAGIAHGSLKSLRHTHATLLLKQGIQPKVVQERLGHSTIAITMDIYSHVMPTMQKEASETFERVLLQGSEQLLSEGNVVEREEGE